MLARFTMWLCHMLYVKERKKNPETIIFFIKGNGKDYPKHLLYTENEKIYEVFNVL